MHSKKNRFGYARKRNDHPVKGNQASLNHCRVWKSTTSVLTATALVYTFGAGITAAAGTRLALQLLLAKRFNFDSFQLPAPYREPALVFVVTTSPCWQGVIYAPAAFLGSGSHFSGSLSGIEP